MSTRTGEPQYRELVAACRTRTERTIVRVLCEAGLRRSELIALQVGDLDLAQGFICVQRRHYRTRAGVTDIDLPKSRKPRAVAINESLCQELRWHLAEAVHPAKSASLWTRCNLYTDGQPQPLTGSALMKLVQSAARRAELTDEQGNTWVTPHVLRATGASIAVAAGVSPHVAKEQLGHAYLRTTQQHYLHLPMTETLKQFGAVFE